MKRLSLVLVGMVALWALPTAASAQGLFGSDGTPGIAGLPFSWPSMRLYAVIPRRRNLRDAKRVFRLPHAPQRKHMRSSATR